MPLLRLVPALLVALALAAGATSAGADASPDAPTGLRAFLLRADEPAATSFSRTPAFAWSPFASATGYEFQLSTSSAFRENGIVWKCPSATCPGLETPVAAPSLSLPWITGSPHGLYARVRAVLPDRTRTEWSAPLGFDVIPPEPPTPLPSRPGLLRWTPVPGASGYQVWLIDARNKVETVYANVLDEREFYTFHQAASWIGAVRWRVRALRNDWKKDERVNGVPVTQYGAWSSIYGSANPTPTAGRIRLGSTVSDLVTNGSSTDLAHRIMPAFTWTGNETDAGTRAELFRVYVYTDRHCLNRVFTGSVVGSPAYAARPYGGLGLPVSGASLVEARGSYLGDLTSRAGEPLGLGYDGEKVSSVESQGAATPTASLPLVGGGGGAQALSPPFVTVAAGTDLGAPVSLWDNEWPNGGYYWTVVPVQAQFFGAAGTTLAAGAPKGSTTVSVAATPGFAKGDNLQLGSGADTEIVTVAVASGGALTFAAPTLNDHSAGEPIVRVGGTVAYQDLELPQDACAAGRVARFGISSEPSVVAGDDPFASGLSPQGRLVSALRTASFYKSPLISWTPALGATAYQVQWSKKASPFDPAPGPGNAEGILTGATSYVLPLTPGTWYYRVRGFDWSLPTGAQEMGWSDVAKIVITRPTFKVVASARRK
jgi:hypothetical protein